MESREANSSCFERKYYEIILYEGLSFKILEDRNELKSSQSEIASPKPLP